MSIPVVLAGLVESKHHFGGELAMIAARWPGAWVDKTPRAIRLRTDDAWFPHFGLSFADGGMLYVDYRPHLRSREDIARLVHGVSRFETAAPYARYLVIVDRTQAAWAADLSESVFVTDSSEAAVAGAVEGFLRGKFEALAA